MSQQGAVKTGAAAAGDLAQVVILRDPITATVTPETSSTGTMSRVAAVAAATVILAANAGRIGATVYNKATAAVLYLSLSASNPVLGAGAERWTVALVPGAYFEVPFGYDGAINGIWDSAEAGACAVITEFTA